MTKVFVSGIFNILHAGHIQFLNDAKKLGDTLVVAVPSEQTLWDLYKRKSSFSDAEKKLLLEALKPVDKVIITTGDEKGLEFRKAFIAEKPDILAVTTDDIYGEQKQKLCAKQKAKYIVLEKSLPPLNSAERYETSSKIERFIKAPTWVPLRVDFAGGWLDVPKNAAFGNYIVNCAVSPMVSAKNWVYRKSAGMGGSAAWSILTKEDAVKAELALGVGWQDPAVITETGACVWKTGKIPELDFKNTGAFLRGRMAIYDTQCTHDTPKMAKLKRNFKKIAQAAEVARKGVLSQNLRTLSRGILFSYSQQLDEGMRPLPKIKKAMAWKYCGGGHGGYALYLFKNESDRQAALQKEERLHPIEPYCRSFAEDESHAAQNAHFKKEGK